MKKTWIPLILYAYLVIRGLGSLGSNISGVFSNLRTLNILGVLASLLGLAGILVPVFALLGILILWGIIKNEKLMDNLRTWMVPLCYVMAASSALGVIRIIRSFTMMGFSMDFYSIVSGGLVSSILSSVTGVVIYVVVAGMIKKQPGEISKKYRFVFYAVLFVLIFFGALVLISGGNVFGGLLSLLGAWFLPLVFVKAENSEKVVKEATIAVAVIAGIMLIAYLSSQDSGRSSYSSIVPEDLQKLGVSEKEYMEVYNYYKNGVNFGN